MEIGIVGLPASGKTTVFNAVTRGSAEVAAYGAGQTKPNIGVAKVYDPRLDAVESVFKPKRKVLAEIAYVDIPVAPEGLSKTQGISGELLNHLQRTDALMVVARAFEDPSVPRPEGSIDAFRDVEAMRYELTFADLDILARRLERLDEQSKGAKASERDTMSRERDLLDRLKVGLEAGTAISDQTLGQEERRLLSGFQFLTAKPHMVVVNIGEDQLGTAGELEEHLSSEMVDSGAKGLVICAKLEMELAEMESDEEREFRESMGLGESSLDRMVRLSREVLDQITFFTANANEARAWTVERGATAARAAGTIHSDFERGFIRAEVIGIEDLAECGSMAGARSRGLLRQEGKGYVVRDGDVINILFNV